MQRGGEQKRNVCSVLLQLVKQKRSVVIVLQLHRQKKSIPTKLLGTTCRRGVSLAGDLRANKQKGSIPIILLLVDAQKKSVPREILRAAHQKRSVPNILFQLGIQKRNVCSVFFSTT